MTTIAFNEVSDWRYIGSFWQANTDLIGS